MCPFIFWLQISSWICDGPEVEKRVVFHSQLKNVYISEFGKTKNEIDFALYIVKSAIQLQQMYICSGAKTYFGLSGWKVLDRPSIRVIRWSKETYENIHKQLKDQAVSKTVRVIIQNTDMGFWQVDFWNHKIGKMIFFCFENYQYEF